MSTSLPLFCIAGFLGERFAYGYFYPGGIGGSDERIERVFGR